MQKVRNRPLIVVIVFVVAMCACLHTRAEARDLAFGATSYSTVKAGPGYFGSGEPDNGDSGKAPHTSGGSTSGLTGGTLGGSSPTLPTSSTLFIAAWAIMRYLGVGW